MPPPTTNHVGLIMFQICQGSLLIDDAFHLVLNELTCLEIDYCSIKCTLHCNDQVGVKKIDLNTKEVFLYHPLHCIVATEWHINTNLLFRPFHEPALSLTALIPK